ncbi:MAG: response regulator [Cyanobacteria bacterium J06641_5]
MSEMLLGLQLDGATGTAQIEAISKQGAYKRKIVFREGAVFYIGEAIPTPYEFINEIARHSHIGVLETVLEFASKRTSVQGVMQAMVEIGVMKWPDIVRAARKHAIAELQELPNVVGQIAFVPETPEFDLSFYDGFSGFNIDALLLETTGPRQANGSSLGNRGFANVQPTILSVDDSSIAQALIKRALGRQYCVETCNSVFEAFRLLNERDDIALILLDLTMPGINGLEFCQTLRKIEKFRGLPIIMLTARDGVVDRFRSRLVGVTYYLTKPVKASELHAVVAQYIVQ